MTVVRFRLLPDRTVRCLDISSYEHDEDCVCEYIFKDNFILSLLDKRYLVFFFKLIAKYLKVDEKPTECVKQFISTLQETENYKKLVYKNPAVVQTNKFQAHDLCFTKLVLLPLLTRQLPLETLINMLILGYREFSEHKYDALIFLRNSMDVIYKNYGAEQVGDVITKIKSSIPEDAPAMHEFSSFLALLTNELKTTDMGIPYHMLYNLAHTNYIKNLFPFKWLMLPSRVYVGIYNIIGDVKTRYLCAKKTTDIVVSISDVAHFLDLPKGECRVYKLFRCRYIPPEMYYVVTKIPNYIVAFILENPFISGDCICWIIDNILPGEYRNIPLIRALHKHINAQNDKLTNYIKWQYKHLYGATDILSIYDIFGELEIHTPEFKHRAVRYCRNFMDKLELCYIFPECISELQLSDEHMAHVVKVLDRARANPKSRHDAIVEELGLG